MIGKIKEGFYRACSFASNLSGYLINDPTTPDLSSAVSMPKKGLLNFSVKDMSENPQNSVQKRATNCHIVIGNCINNMQLRTKNPIKTWASTSNLQVIPAAGQEMNAYYDRRSLRFFYYPYMGKNVYFADSADIVTHELGHAFLDAIRPDFWSVQSLEIWSFHEAFSDIVAMFNLMCYDQAVDAALAQTKGDLSKSNVISKLAEEVGIMIKNVTKDPSYLPNALRDPAVENFKYIDPSMLPKDAPNNALAAECHSFGRVFSNAWYAIFVKFFELHSKNSSPREAFHKARDSAFSILVQAVQSSARTDRYYSSVAKSMVVVGRGKNNEYGDIIASVLTEWNILTPSDLKTQSSPDLRFKVVAGLKRQDLVLKTHNSISICVKNDKFFDIGELPIFSLMSGVPQDLKIEVPYDTYYEFDSQGNLLDQVLPDEDSIKKSAADCLMLISGDIGSEKMWDIKDGLLKRQFIV